MWFATEVRRVARLTRVATLLVAWLSLEFTPLWANNSKSLTDQHIMLGVSQLGVVNILNDAFPIKLMNPSGRIHVAAVLVYESSQGIFPGGVPGKFVGCLLRELPPHGSVLIPFRDVPGHDDAGVVARYATVISVPKTPLKGGIRLADGLGIVGDAWTNNTYYPLHPSLFTLPSNDFEPGQREEATRCVRDGLGLLFLPDDLFSDFGVGVRREHRRKFRWANRSYDSYFKSYSQGFNWRSRKYRWLSKRHTMFGVSQLIVGTVDGGQELPLMLMNPNATTHVAAALFYRSDDGSVDAHVPGEYTGCVVVQLAPNASIGYALPVIDDPQVYVEVISVPVQPVKGGTRLADGLGIIGEATFEHRYFLVHPSLFTLPSNDVDSNQKEDASFCVRTGLGLLSLPDDLFSDFGIGQRRHARRRHHRHHDDD